MKRMLDDLWMFGRLAALPREKTYNIPELMRKQSKGEYLTPAEKNMVIAHAQMKRKEKHK